jgi:hypothetical protein
VVAALPKLHKFLGIGGGLIRLALRLSWLLGRCLALWLFRTLTVRWRELYARRRSSGHFSRFTQ